mgnify:FL=1
MSRTKPGYPKVMSGRSEQDYDLICRSATRYASRCRWPGCDYLSPDQRMGPALAAWYAHDCVRGAVPSVPTALM